MDSGHPKEWFFFSVKAYHVLSMAMHSLGIYGGEHFASSLGYFGFGGNFFLIKKTE